MLLKIRAREVQEIMGMKAEKMKIKFEKNADEYQTHQCQFAPAPNLIREKFLNFANNLPVTGLLPVTINLLKNFKRFSQINKLNTSN